jgi:hypothetical protein
MERRCVEQVEQTQTRSLEEDESKSKPLAKERKQFRRIMEELYQKSLQ